MFKSVVRCIHPQAMYDEDANTTDNMDNSHNREGDDESDNEHRDTEMM
jgi:hypothetical protein